MSNEQDVASLNAPHDNNPNGSTNVIIQSSEKQFTETSPSVRGKTDPAWEHFAYKKDGRTIVYTCLHCGSNFKGGGINRMKHHLAGIPGQISSCKKVSHDIRQRMRELLKNGQKRKNEDLNGAYNDQFIKEEVQKVHPYPNVGNMQSITPKEKSKVNKIDSYFTPRTTPAFHPSLKTDLSNEEALHKAKMAIARWFFDASIPFSATQSPYFQNAMDAITAVGPGFKVPSYHELRVNLLGDCKKECQLLIEGYRVNWAKSGCTILVDGWSDQSQRTLINFLVYCPTGMAFVKSVDASDIVKDAKTLCNMFSDVIEWVGAENVVHIVTDNAAIYVDAGRLIHEKYETIFWSPCAAHCVNLLLKDIANMSHVADVVSKASKITVFVYNQMTLLSWLRKRKGWKEIVHTGATKFATTFITLKNIYDRKHDLEALVLDKHFTSGLAKSATGEAVSAIILDSKFWNDCFMIAKLVAPIIRLQKIVDKDETPSLGYVYEGMQRAKHVIKEMFGNTRLLYKPYTNIIRARWDKHLKHGLHAATYFLNPAFFYDENFSEKNRVTQALLDLFEIKDFCNDVSKAIQELQVYRDCQGSFSQESALTSRKKVQPDEWWRLYGGSAPIVQKLAIRLLCQTSSSLGCEKNWNVFECIHAKKRNRLEHQRLNDLVYVTYNLRLQKRWHHRKTCHDPIDYEFGDKVDFWLAEEETSPELDIDEIENAIYDESAIPIGESSKNNEGDEDLDTTEFQFESGDGSSGEDVFNIFEYKGINLDECYGD